jgi:hypothetical protein
MTVTVFWSPNTRQLLGAYVRLIWLAGPED